MQTDAEVKHESPEIHARSRLKDLSFDANGGEQVENFTETVCVKYLLRWATILVQVRLGILVVL